MKQLNDLLEQYCPDCGRDSEDTEMSQSELFNLVDSAQELYDLIQGGLPMEDWMEAKVTIATQNINSVLDQLKFASEEPEQINKPSDFDDSVKVYIGHTKMFGEKKLCKRGKAAAKARYKKYPSAYANLHASSVCSGKAKDLSGKKKKS